MGSVRVGSSAGVITHVLSHVEEVLQLIKGPTPVMQSYFVIVQEAGTAIEPLFPKNVACHVRLIRQLFLVVLYRKKFWPPE